MLPTIFAMLLILLVAAAIFGMVVVGMEGTGRHRVSDLAQHLARAGRHLNGEADPPKGLVSFFEQAEEGADDLRQLPSQLVKRRSASSASSAPSASGAEEEPSAHPARTARSARSARSAPTAGSAPTARSAATPPRPRLPLPGGERPVADAVPAPPVAPAPPSVPATSAWDRPEVRSAWAAAPPSSPARPAAAPEAPAPGKEWAAWSAGGHDD